MGCLRAEPINRLTLTDAEMQKLKRYFPVEESANTGTSMPITTNALSQTLPFENAKKSGCITTTSAPLPREEPVNSTVSEVDLLRFAFQTLYAPLAVRNRLPLYTRAPLHSTPFVTGLIRQAGVMAHPLASWTAGGQTVTAVALQNTSPYRIVLHRDHDFCGAWRGAVLYPRAILPSRQSRDVTSRDQTARDQTMLFLLSDQPFGEALAVCHGHV